MDTSYQDRIYDEYFQSVYKHVNLLNEEQYQKAADQFDLMYREILPKEKDAAILDFGCGTGHFLFFLKCNGYQNITGIDRSAQQIEYCRKHVHDCVQVVDGLEFLANQHDTYDAISAHDVLEHFSKDQTLSFLDLVYQGIKPGGLLILRVPNMSNPFSLDSRYNDFTHETGFTSKNLVQLLSTVGFKDIQVLPQKIAIRSFRNFLLK